MCLSTCERGDALHEVEYTLGRPTFFREHRLDDFAGFGLGETATAQEGLAIIVVARDNTFTRRPDAGNEGRWRGIGETRQCGCRLMREALGRKFRVPDGDLLEILRAPKISVGTNGPQVKAGNS